MSLLISNLPVIAMLRGLIRKHSGPAFEVSVIKISFVPEPKSGQTREEIRRFITDHHHPFSPATDGPGMHTLPRGWYAWRVEDSFRTMLATAVFDGECVHRMTIFNSLRPGESWTKIIG